MCYSGTCRLAVWRRGVPHGIAALGDEVANGIQDRIKNLIYLFIYFLIF